ncbi:hypothetical protein VNO77_44356 [Canavalia gladiata]|uniref:Uncharacterized protein n=1 Tax=Canavalia gladiata TaxID=3824 RepID=A0AAN9JWL1_CANGL
MSNGDVDFLILGMMDNQDQETTHIQGHESHACHTCGKKICGTVEGPNALDTGNNEKVNGGTGENLIRSGDEVFLDAIANFSDGALSPGVKESLRDSLDSATDVEVVNIKYPELSGSSADNDFNAADVNQLIVKTREQDPNILEREKVENGNMLDPLSSSISDLGTVAHNDDYFGLSCDSNSSKAEATPDVLLENKICAGKNVKDYNFTSVAKDTILKENDEIKSDYDMVEIMDSSGNILGDKCEETPKVAVIDVVSSDCQVAGGAFNLKENNNAEFLSMMPQDEFPLEVNYVLSTNTSTNGVQVDSAHMIQFATCGDVKKLQERGEGNANVFTCPSCDDRPDVAHPQNENADFKDHKRVLPQNSLNLPSFEAWEPKQDDLTDSVAEENNFVISQRKLGEKREVLLPEGRVAHSSMKEPDSYELGAEEMLHEESIEVSSIKFMIKSDRRSDETGASMNTMKTEMNERHMIHFSEERGPDDVRKKSQQISLPEGSFTAASKNNSHDTSFGGSTTKTTSVIGMDKISHHEKYIKEINNIAVDGECRGTNVENDNGISMKTLQLSNLHLEVKPSSGVYKSDNAAEMGKFEKCDITDAQYMERPIAKDSSLPDFADSNSESPNLSEIAMDRSARTAKGGESVKTGPLSGVQEGIKDDEINSNCRVNGECNRFVSTSVDSHQTQDAELLAKIAEDQGRNYPLLSSIKVEPSAQCVPVVEDPQEGERSGKLFGITSVPGQDQSGNKEVQLPSFAIYTSADSGIQCGSLEGNWGSVSVSVSGLPATDLVVSTEAGGPSLKDPKAASERQQCENSEVFEPPSFMTLVESGHVVGPKAAESEVQQGLNQNPPSANSLQAGWFPTLTQVTNESQGRKRNEEIIAKITDCRTSKQHTPLLSPLGEAAHSNKPNSPIVKINSVNGKNGESAAGKAVKGEDEKGWNSPARYPADIKRQNKKIKSRPYWIQFVCCSSVNSPRR